MRSPRKNKTTKKLLLRKHSITGGGGGAPAARRPPAPPPLPMRGGGPNKKKLPILRNLRLNPSFQNQDYAGVHDQQSNVIMISSSDDHDVLEQSSAPPSSLPPAPPPSSPRFSSAVDVDVDDDDVYAAAADDDDDDDDDDTDLPFLCGEDDEDIDMDDDLLYRGALLAFTNLMDDIGLISYFTSTAGGKLSITTVKMYISRFQHYMLFCRTRYSVDTGHYSVVDRPTFLAFFEIILAHMSDWLPPYTEDLSEREDLAPDTVRNVVNHTLAIVKWYLLFAPRLLAETGMDTAHSNLLLSQVMSLCHHLSRQLGKQIKKQRTGSGRDLIEFKVCMHILCILRIFK